MGGGEVIQWPIPGEAGTAWRARPFGQTSNDLEVDLRRAVPLATTAVLAACLAGPEGAPTDTEVWSWTVNRRLQGLLALTVATRGSDWVFSATCSDPECGRPMDLPLRLNDFLHRDDPPSAICTFADGDSLAVRLPTGADQLAWLHQGGSGAAAPMALLVRLLDGLAPPWVDAPPPQRLAAVETALAEADPLTTLEIETVCPECGAENLVPLDLENACLGLLDAEQQRLLDDIHRLAVAYHWSEDQILAIPSTRRRQYLARLREPWP